jgi:carboxylate-amine ligase
VTRFGEADGHTLGVEEEYFLVDPETRAAASAADDIVPAAPGERSENVQFEFYQCVVETATDVCSDSGELRAEIKALRQLVDGLAEDAGVDLAATGTHPTAPVEEAKVTDKPRYAETVDIVGWPALWELVCGHHVHVAVPTREDAIFVHNRMRTYVPHLVLLSANSPFWEGEATGYMSSRLPIWDGMPRAGLPRAFDDWADFQDTVEVLKQGGVIDDVTRLWWDVRPRPDLGTVEVRIADMPTTVEDSMALAGFIQALVARLCQARRRDEDLRPLPRPEVLEVNRNRAQRHGTQAPFLRATDEGIELVPGAEAVADTIAWLDDVPGQLGVEQAIDRVETIVRSQATGADRQLAVREKGGSFEAVVDDIRARTVPEG